MPQKSHYDIVVVGSGFASTFFLYALLNRSKKKKRILVLEAGSRTQHSHLVRDTRFLHLEANRYFSNKTPSKPWVFTRAFGGGSNCWYGSAPRMMPHDFKLATTYGIGTDWPLSYDDLEEYYSEAERIMDISGDQNFMPYPMSQPYPQPPHRFSEPDRLLKSAYPDRFFHLPTARARLPNRRPACCNNAVCHLCPIDAKFTIENGLASVYEHDDIELLVNTPAIDLGHHNDTISTISFESNGSKYRASADLFVLGANALFNPTIMLRSGLVHPELGRGLCEQIGFTIRVTFSGLRNYQGSTITTGLGFNDLYGDHRRHRAGILFHTVNRPTNLNLEKGKWFSTLEIIAVLENLRLRENYVTLGGMDNLRPVTVYNSHPDYSLRTVRALPAIFEKLLKPLPVESIQVTGPRPTESHIQGTTVMGESKATSVVDKQCLHHQFRNLIVLGSGNFPSASPSNPSLTIASLSMYSATNLFR